MQHPLPKTWPVEIIYPQMKNWFLDLIAAAAICAAAIGCVFIIAPLVRYVLG
jgi:hypothetical protein